MAKKAVRASLSAKLRPVVQILFLFFFLSIFLKLSYPLRDHIGENFFFNLDPLIVLALALSGSAILMTLFASVITVIASVVFGRVFCGWLCPLGSIYDLFAHILPKRKTQPAEGKGPYKNYKYYLLAFILASAVFGFSAALFFDPLVFLYRIFTFNVFPSVVLLINITMDIIRPLALKMGMMNLYMFSLEQPVFNVFGFVNLVLFLAVVGLIVVERRFWCRNLCPLGAMLSLMSRFSLWGRHVSSDCIHCSKCTRECPMNSIAEGHEDTSMRECIQCQRCETVCPTNAITFGFGSPTEQRFEVNPSRRSIIFSAVGGIVTALSAGTSRATKTTSETLLRPPGSLEEKDFLDACLRCGECMKVCPTNALQPAKLEAGIEGMFTPKLTPRVGGCEEQCNLCGQVCPTGAIRKLPVEEKQYAVIGNATIDRKLCIAWEQLKVCLICDEVCPFDAIEFKMVKDEKGTLQRPFVTEDKCVGCGQCEFGCPVKGEAAIRVLPVNEVRKNDGSYITERVKQLREVNDEGVEFYDEYEEESGTSGGAKPSMPWEQQGSDDGGDLPPGFVE